MKKNKWQLLAVVIVFCGVNTNLFSQDSTTTFTKELSFKTENDAYLFQLNDAYYTNGFFLNYRWVKQGTNRKKINDLEWSQQIFTPLNRTTQVPSEIDRPYAGYMHVKYSMRSFSKKAVLNWSGTLGIVGKAAGGEWMQNWYHDLLRFAKFRGWQYQVENAIGINAQAAYAYTLYEKGLLKIAPTVDVHLGTLFTNAKLGGTVVFGVFEKNERSALWDARIDHQRTTRNRHNELFVYWRPFFIAQAYNATVQGGMGVNGTTQVTRDIAPTMFQQSWGLCYAEARWTTRLEFVYQSKETPSQIKPQRYGVIQLCYRMR